LTTKSTRTVNIASSGAVTCRTTAFANGLPQFPGDPASSVFLENSKGYAIGYTALLHPNLTSSFRYGYTRQGQEYTGILNAPFVYFRDIDTRYATSTGLTRITPVHQLSEDLAWSHGAHNLTFGGVVRLINNHRLDYGHSFSNIETNGSVLITGVVSSSRPMLKTPVNTSVCSPICWA